MTDNISRLPRFWYELYSRTDNSISILYIKICWSCIFRVYFSLENGDVAIIYVKGCQIKGYAFAPMTFEHAGRNPDRATPSVTRTPFLEVLYEGPPK